MVSTGVKAGLVSMIVILIAFMYKKDVSEELDVDMKQVLSGLLRAERKAGQIHDTRVAVGFGACQDIFSDAIEVMKRVDGISPKDPAHFDEITSKLELERSFAYFFRHGAAAERYVTNETLFLDIAAKAKEIPGRVMKMGGNAPVMASRLYQEGLKVMLGARITKELRKELDPEIYVVGEEIDEDDLHLILEYPKGAKWGDWTAPRANRFIIHNDDNNPRINSLEAFAKEIKEFSPSLFVIGGLQMLDNFPFQEGQRQERLGKLQDVLKEIPKETKIHFELASFAEEDCLKDVVKNVVYYSDSLGMNEQELPNLHSLLTNGSVTLISDPYPRVATTLDQMRDVYRDLRNTPERDGKRKLNRLHVHTLAYQAILTTKDSGWKNTMSAAAKASLTANRHVCGSDYIHTEKAKILMDDSFSTSRDKSGKRVPFESNRPVSCWEEEDFEICVAPVLVCTEVVQTGGGGDNISSAGLVLQI